MAVCAVLTLLVTSPVQVIHFVINNLSSNSIHVRWKVQGNLVSVKGVSPELAVASGNKNGGNGITKNNVAGNQDDTLDIEQYQNSENSQHGGGGGGLLGGLL